MGFGGALSFNGIDATIAAGSLLIPAVQFPAISIAAVDCYGAPEPTVSFSYSIPAPDISLNVLVNGYSMTVNNDGFGDLNVSGDLSLTLPECSPAEGFSVPDIATAQNILVNGIKAAVPNIPPLTMPPVIDEAKMAMTTLTTNVMLYW